ncbi:MAG TPA: FtsX-like permease family protein, partial [Ktedonobacterales bacterium]|nr:FtsX-like permease family protein [Ktedonobacterales bacterium]
PDFQLTVDRVDPSLLPGLQAVADVKAVQEVSTFGACWQPVPTGCSISLDIYSAPDLQHIPITPFQLTAGHYPGVGEIVMEQGDQSLHGVGIGDLVTVHVGDQTAQARVVGLSRTPGVDPRTSGDALGYMSDTGLQRLVATLGNPMATGPSGQQTPVYQHHIQVTFKSTSPQIESAAVTALQHVVQAHGVTVLGSGFAPKVDASTLGTIDGVFSLMRTLALVAVVLSALLILNTITTLVAEQTAIIGTMKALGGSRGTIIRGYLVSVGMYSLLATLPALALGLYAGNQLATALAPQIPLQLGPFAVAPWVVALSLVVGLGVPLLAALVPLWNGTRITVREALAAYGVGVGQGRTILARLGTRLTWVSQTIWLGLRGLFRRRWRAALALATLSLAAACFLVVQTATTSVNDTIGAVRAPLSADMTVNFRDPSTYGQIQQQLSALPNVAGVERSGSTHASTPWGTLQVSGYEPDTRLYHYQLTSGRWLQPGDTNVVLLSDAAAQKTGLHAGDTITLTNSFGSSTQLTLTIIGTVRQSIDVLGWIGAAVLPVNTLNELRGIPADRAATSTDEIIVGAQDRSLAAVDRLAGQVSAVVNPGGASSDDPGYYSGNGGTVDTFHEYTARRQGDAYILYYLLYALALVVGIVGILGLANALVASVLERRREIGLLRAMGASGRRVAQVFWVESLALGALSWGIGALIGLPLAYAFVQTFAWQVMPVDFYLDPLAFAVMLAAVVAIATLASIVPAWRASRVRIAAMLRYE